MGLFPDLPEAEHDVNPEGILPSQEIRRYISGGRIRSTIEICEEQIQPASIDLRLGTFAYRVQASFLPGRSCTVETKIRDWQIDKIDLTAPATFDRGSVFVVPLMESLALPDDVGAKANPKSTTGRLDVFTRLITEYGEEFECVPKGYSGPLYVEIVSRTFTIKVRAGMKLNQLRFERGNPSSGDTMLTQLDRREILVYEDQDSPARANIKSGLRISVDLKGNGESNTVAYRAKKNAPPIELDKIYYYDPAEFWEFIRKPPREAIILDPGDFYLLASKQRIRVPPGFAAEMVPFDPSIGEFRIHYAGFFDPGFGYGPRDDIRGTKAVLEARAHEVPIMLEDNQVIGRLLYTRMTVLPDKVYGPAIGSSYQQQGLALSKQFKSVIYSLVANPDS